ncbi:amino acid dehydrogenase [Pandoraea anapnoica]|uniref:Amino acid dehydrogenase n=1 Tax=Pandoraea anapnoica TaxID=2508301 RepID=A0A5E4ZZR2_9BURK|nr:FAD-binding oxidoreductase [Pandoraea anapnoica]VVE66899.1 amino acid dehydrogenase [Pandoraea anapnoica]
MTVDVLVLGAGIVGTSTAIHLQRRGLNTVLIDRAAPGRETSYGNAGLIQREGVYPYAFARDIGTLLRYARNQSTDVRYHLAALPGIAPFLARYWHHSAPHRHAQIARHYSTLIEHCLTEHNTLIERAGAQDLLREGGWLKIFHTAGAFDAAYREAERWRSEYDVPFEPLDPVQLQRDEPSLARTLAGAIRYTASGSIRDPGELVSRYAQHFKSLGGRIVRADATTLKPHWRVQTEDGEIEGRHAVVAMGPWSDTVTNALGYRLPLVSKRGYHRHFRPENGATLNQTVLDAERGFVMAPMNQGIRLTTGVELALRDAPRTPVQLAAVEPLARSVFPLGTPVEAQPWMGSRPCTPDMLPIIGPALRHRDLWFAFGHAHHGLTLGPVTGRLIAEMISGERTLVDPTPFRTDRF